MRIVPTHTSSLTQSCTCQSPHELVYLLGRAHHHSGGWIEYSPLLVKEPSNNRKIIILHLYGYYSSRNLFDDLT